MIILYFSCPFLAKPPRKRTHARTEGLRHGSKLEYSILIFVLVPEEVSTSYTGFSATAVCVYKLYGVECVCTHGVRP